MRAVFAFAFLLVLGVSHGVDFSVGVSPSVVEAGMVRPGEDRLLSFSIFTVSDEPLLVYFDVENGNMDFFNKGYRNLMFNFSEEGTAPWVEILNAPVEIDTSGSKTAGRSWTDVSFLLHVPEDAEPGWHVATIRPRPTVFGTGPAAPVGASIVQVVTVSVLFGVQGEAKRAGTILDTTAAGYAGEPFGIKTFFKNTGTVTLYSRAVNHIYGENSTFFGEFSSARVYVRPGGTAAFEAPVSGAMPEGEYSVRSFVSFTTGDDQHNSTIRLLYPTGEGAKEETQFIPLLLIILIAVYIAYRWWRERA